LSYVKCLVCGSKLKMITENHVKRHGLTMARYRQLYPEAPIISPELRQKVKIWSGDRKFQRKCKKCGSLFTTGNPRVFYCPKCQEKISVEKQRRYHKRNRIREKNTRKTKRNQRIGTFGKGYLEIVNGRVRGAVLLEKGLSPNGSNSHNDVCGCGSAAYLVAVLGDQLYCLECGGQIILARENENYTMPIEVACSKCGVVYEPPP